MTETRGEWTVAKCGHEVQATVYAGSDGSEQEDVPDCCASCEQIEEGVEAGHGERSGPPIL